MTVAVDHNALHGAGAGAPGSGDPPPVNTTGSVPRLDPSLPQVFGRYLLVQRLSRGGMGEIFLAKHGLQGFEKLCVIKKVLPNLAEDQQFISRFVDEAQVAIKLQHVNVAQVFEVGRVGDEYFLSIEYVEGRDLRRILHVLGKHRRRFPPELALYIGREMANGLAYAHRRTSVDGASLELVHCDISPPNVLVSFEGETKIIDFGIAKSALRETATDPKMGFGKFGYMAPEQLIRGGVVDHRTDIYAAGVVLFELLTGERLYELGPDGQAPDYRALARAVSRGEHKVPSDLDPLLEPFDELVRRALKPRAEDRYQTAAELRDAIQTELVQLNPTISADQLGSFMRDTFAAEMSAHRDMVERIAHTHLDQFKDQLTTQSVATVSFALANMPLVAPTEEPRAVRAAPQRHDQQSTAVAGMMIADSGRTATVELGDRDLLPLDARRGQPRDRRRLSWPVIGATSVAVIVAVALAVWAAGGGSRPPAPAAGSTAVGGGAGGVAADAGAPTVTALDPADVVVADADADAGEPAIEIDPIVEPPPGDPSPPPRDGGKARVRTAKSKGDDHAAKARVDHGDDKPAPTVDADAVLGKFKAVSREYKTFKQAYGARLDAEWTELATLAQYAGKSPDKLAALDRKLDRFRSQMRAQK